MRNSVPKAKNRAERVADAVIEEVREAGDEVFKKALIQTMEFMTEFKATEIALHEVFLAGLEAKDPVILLSAIIKARNDLRKISMLDDLVPKSPHLCKVTELVDRFSDGKLLLQEGNFMHMKDASNRMRVNLLAIAEEHVSNRKISTEAMPDLNDAEVVNQAPKLR